jgi:Phage-related minor tail protein
MAKKLLLIIALLCAVAQGAWAQNSWEEVYALTQTTSGDWTAINSGSTSGHTLGSTGNTTYYYVNSNLSFTNSNVGGSGLKIQGTVYLYVPEGVTLTCTGANANGQTGAGAGIELASGNTLYLLGGGTVNATGGNAANGGSGGTGGDATGSKGDWTQTGAGGTGGTGGGGAGAGIGTRGGAGGSGGSGGAGHRYDNGEQDDAQNGTHGSAGSAGSTAGAMGNLYWLQSFVHMTATGGSQGTSGGSGGQRGRGYAYDGYSYNVSVAGGGGGGGGGFGGAASNIGTGGPGGGGGGGGAGGAQDWKPNSTGGFYDVTAYGGKGGQNANGEYAADGTEAATNGTANNQGWVTVENGSANSWSPASGACTFGNGGSGGACGNTSTSITIVTSEMTTMTSGIYTVLTDVTISNRITINGNVVLNLGEGATLHAPKGIDVSGGNSLIINGPGTLTIDGCDSNNAGIGAQNVGTLTINGGIINVRGGSNGAGIGGNAYNDGGGTITINGGIVNANGGYGAAGIGGGICDGTYNNGHGTGMCGNVYIYGGQVTAVGGSKAAGIGPGVYISGFICMNLPTSGNLTIGWTNPEDFLYNSGFYSKNGSYYNQTLSGISFVEGKQFIIDGLGEIANPSLPTNFGSRKILPLVDQATALPGSGSLSDPYRISNLSDWMKLAVNVNGGTKNYSGEYVRLENDLSVSIMVGKDETNSFQGTFLGNNKTLTFSYSTWEENTAPFRVTNNATIKDLKVAGSISTSAKFAAGLASRTFGTTSITNCQVDTYIHSNINGDGTHGGIVAMPNGTLNIEGCAFTGRLLTNKGTHSCGGFVGWHNSSTISVINSLYAPSSSIPSGWSAITGGATFVRGGSPTINNCYYTEKLGDVQGSLVLVYPSDPGNLGNVVQAYSTLTAYTNGIFCDDIYYLKAATFSGAGNEGSPYLISNEFEWKSFAAYVNSGSNTYSGKYMKLTADISVTEMVGSSEGNSFQGTFLGDGVHTLTFTQGTSESAFNEQNCAPFRYVNGATIRDLKVAGYIYTSQKLAAGLVSRPYGTTNITNCQVSTVIYSSVNGDSAHGGIVAMPSGTLNFAGCVYTGHLLTNNGSINCGGFVGWYNSATVSATNSLYVPSGSIADGWSAITDGVTFVRGGSPTINNSYYTEALGTEQGKMVYTITTTVPTNLGTLKADYSMLKAYTNGILYDGTYYVTRALNGTGTEGSPYIIADADDWGTFVYNVNNGYNNYNGEFVRLDANINISQTIGLRDNRPFSGTFLGNGNTITASIISTTTGEGANEQGVAPFHYINNATIKDLTVAGSIASASYHTSGIVGFANGTNTIEDCLVTATLNITSNYAGGIIGHGLNSNTTIRGCAFAGTINGVDVERENIGGIWGWSTSGTPTLLNCLENGTYTNIASMHPMGLQNGSGTITNCYYVKPKDGNPTNACTVSGAVQALTDEEIQPLGEPVATYSTSGINVYANGISYGGNFYYHPDKNIKHTIEGYGTGNGKWAFIASPVVENIDPSMVGNLLGNVIPETDPVQYDFDFYRLNPTNAMWENYNNPTHQAGFNLVNGQGYLYATKETKTLVFSGTFNTESSKTVELSEGFNLVGNPLVVDAYVSKPFYQMNADGTDIEPVANYDEYSPVTIPPCYGVVVRASGADEVTFSTSAPDQQSSANNGNLQMTLTKADVRSDAYQDKAIVSFNADSKLEKFIFNENHAKLYIPQDGNDYAIAFSDKTGEVPLHFKAQETGRYTIGFNFENVKGVRIQLIDKLEDRIIDLKAIDNYTFMGSTADRDDRFTLVFTQVETGSIFAYQEGNDIIVSCEGELQVFDLMGRKVMNQHVNGVETIEKPSTTGVYILRLNGMTQKIVVR